MTKATATKSTATKAPKISKAEKELHDKRSAAVAESWKDKQVAAARAARNHVKCDSTEYRSVRAAFEALGLPLGRHIAFRQQLKAEGRKSFEGHRFVLL